MLLTDRLPVILLKWPLGKANANPQTQRVQLCYFLTVIGFRGCFQHKAHKSKAFGTQ